MPIELNLGEITVDVVLKDIKNIHLSVYPPTGRVHISAPERIDLDTLRVYAISKLDWIKQQQKKFQNQERETQREYLNRESHFVFGKRYLLRVEEEDKAPTIELKHSHIVLTVRSGTPQDKREALIAAWYREQVRKAIIPLLEKWEPLIGVKVNQCFVRRMKTKWGSCNPSSHNIRLNTELAKKPMQCLEYILVHEMLHFYERHHNDRFTALMNQYMPQWKAYRDELNQAPLCHEVWTY